MREPARRGPVCAEARLRPDQAPDPTAAHQRRPRAGAATRPRTGTSSSTSAMRVAHTGTPRTKLCVPSMGSTTQRRARSGRRELLALTASRGRVRLSWEADELLGGPVGVADQREVRLGLDPEVLGAEAGRRDALDGVREDVGEAQVVVVAGHAAPT